MPPMNYKGFQLRPALEVEERYDDNIFVQENNKEGDFITIVRPELLISKDIGRHNFKLEAKGAGKYYASNSDENVMDGSVKLSTNLEAYHSLNIPFEVSYVIDHQDRTNRSTSARTKEPQELHYINASGGINYKPNRLGLEFLGYYSQLRAEDTVNSRTNVVTPGEDRDVNVYGASLTASYDTGAWLTPQASVVYEFNDDVNPTYMNGGFNGTERDNTLLRFLAGVRMDYKDMILGSIGVGYEQREYDDNTIDSIEAISLSGELGLKIDRKTLISLELERVTKEDNEILAGITSTSFGLSARRELNSRVFVEATGNYKFTEFNSSRREDEEYKLGLGLSYIIDKGLFLEGQYAFGMRDSTQTGLSYDRNIFLINLRKEF